jgi:tRNA(fMet)-specific endonuclease VapC
MAGKVLLDTNIVIAYLRDDEAITLKVHNTPEIFIPSIVIGELYYGAYKSASRDRNIQTIADLCEEADVLTVNEHTARYYGLIKQALRAKGRPIPANDMWIAAVALQHNLTVITRDDHFKEVEGLSMEVW